LVAVLPAVLCAGALYAQEYPVMNMIADRVIQKYPSSSCEIFIFTLVETGGKGTPTVLTIPTG
jgi:hypothetical protein